MHYCGMRAILFAVTSSFNPLQPLRSERSTLHVLPNSAPEREVAPLVQQFVSNSIAKANERNAWLSPNHSESRHFLGVSPSEMWTMFTPTYPCMWTLQKEPSSAVQHDGGKWICGLQELGRAPRAQRKGGCVVYSIGSNNQFAFEKQVHHVAKSCDIHTFDPTVRRC